MDAIENLREVKLFAGFSADETAAIEARGRRRSLEKGKPLFRMGDTNHSLFVLTRGAVQVERPGTAERTLLTTLHPGQIFGEMSFMDGSRATATVLATESCEVLEIPHAALEALLKERPEMSGKLWKNLALELRARLAATNKLVDHYADIQQILLDDPSLRDACIRA